MKNNLVIYSVVFAPVANQTPIRAKCGLFNENSRVSVPIFIHPLMGTLSKSLLLTPGLDL